MVIWALNTIEQVHGDIGFNYTSYDPGAYIMNDKKQGVPTGAVGLTLAVIAFAARVIVPAMPSDPRAIVASMALVLWLVGLIVSIIGTAKDSGRIAGVAGIFFAAFYWIPAMMR